MMQPGKRTYPPVIVQSKMVFEMPLDQGDGPLPLGRMCQDTPEGPMYIPLQRAAEAYWKERGYL